MLLLWILCVAGISLSSALHNSHEVKSALTAEEYLEELTESVNSEIEGNSMMGHKPPNRWYYSADNMKNQITDKLVEKSIALLVIKHYNYLIHLRRQLAKLNNKYPDKVDLWPFYVHESKAPLGEAPKGESPNGSDEIGHTEEEQGSRFVGWKQPEWMDNLFDEMEG